jgi:hypothetical protein
MTTPSALEIPSPRPGSEFAPEEFDNFPEDTRSRVSDQDEEGGVNRTTPSSGGSTRAAHFPTRTDTSQHSSKSGGSVKSRGPPPPAERLAPLFRRLDALEARASLLEDSLPTSFVLARDELDKIWKNLKELEHASASRKAPPSSPSFFQTRVSTTGSSPPTATLTPPAFDNLMRPAIDELKAGRFVHQSNLDSRMMSTFLSDIADQLSGLSR